MTQTTPNKKSTVKAHRGMAHVPRRGRRRTPIQRRPVGDPPRRRPPIQKPIGIDRRMTPAQRDAFRRQRRVALARRRAIEALRRRQREALNPKGRPALPIRRRPTVEQLKNARRRRRPVGDPKPRTRVTQARQAPRTIRKPRRPV